MSTNKIPKLYNRSFVIMAALFALTGCLPSGEVDATGEEDSTPPAADVPAENSAPQISGTPSGRVDVGSSYSFEPNASDPDGDDLEFSIQGRPGWASFDARSGRLSGTPSNSDVGATGEVIISVSDGELTASLDGFTITVEEESQADNSAPTISGTPDDAVAVGASYTFEPAASDADGDELTFSITGIPAWATFNAADGRLSGTPGDADVGEWPGIVITVSDGQDEVSLNPFSITVAEDSDPLPVLGSIPDIPFDYAKAPGATTTSGGLPGNLSAGEVLAFTGQSGSQDVSFSCSGTESNPAFIVGGTLSGSNDVLTITGSWCIFVDTKFDNIQVRTSGDHMIFRNIEISNVSGKNGSNLGGSNIVMVDSEIHHNQGDDRHGIQVTSGSDSVWILRNYIHHNGGDGFQACHGCSANPPRNVYIGNNLFHSDRENAVDFKYIENVIVEGNVMHSLVSAPKDEQWCFDDDTGCGVFSSGSDGSAIVVGSDGGPTNVLIVNNEIYGTVNAVRIEEGVQVRIENNTFTDIDRQCLQLDKNGYDTVFSDNSCINAARGIFQNWRENFSLVVDNNVFENVSDAVIEYESSSVGDSSTLTNNLFDATGPVIYNNTVATTATAINALPGSSGNDVQ